jgi:hypothetical protein
MHFTVILLLVILPITTIHARAATECGDPPPVADETLKGEIEGKAQFLSRFLGDARLSGQIETSRREIFSRYPEAERSRSNAYLEYQVCVLLMRDRTMSTQEKINELIRIRREFSKPISGLTNEPPVPERQTAEAHHNGVLR